MTINTIMKKIVSIIVILFLGLSSKAQDCTINMISAVPSACNDNGTPFDPTDDFFTVGVNVSATDAGSSNQFVLSDGTNTTVPFSYGTTGQINLPPDGNLYTITVSDFDDMLCDSSFTITQEPCCQIDINPTIIPVTNLTTVDGEIQLCLNSGTEPFIIEIMPPLGSIYQVPSLCPNSFSITGLPQGTYEVTVTDSLDCQTVLSNIDITGPACTGFQLSDVVANGISCPGATDGTIELNLYDKGDATAITVYPGNGLAPMTFTDLDETLVVTGMPPGTYDVSLFDNNGCEVTFLFNPVVVNDVSPITYEATVTDATTIGGTDGSILLCLDGANGGFTASITPITGTIESSSDCLGTEGLFISDLAAGNYEVTVVDANGCPLTIDFIINDPTCPLSLSVIQIGNIECGGTDSGSLTINVTGATAPYSISTDGGLSFSSEQALPIFVVEDLLAGSYDVIVMDANGCTATFDNPLVINENTPISLDAGVSHATTNDGIEGNIYMCLNGGVSPYSVSVSPNTGVLSQGMPDADCSDAFNLAGVEAGVYDITVTDNLGCEETFQVEVLHPTCPTFEMIDTVLTTVSCYGDNNGSIEINVQGGDAPYTYMLSGIESFTTFDPSYTFVGLDNGEYILSVTDDGGCVIPFPTPITLEEPEALFSIVTVIPPCVGEDNGIICLTPANGTAPYSYNVLNEDDEQMTVKIGSNDECGGDFYIDEEVSAGTYFIELIDANGCKAHSITTVSETSVSVVTLNNTADCTGAAVGHLEVVGAGGTMPYEYLWNNGETTTVLDGLENGSYMVTVTDARGCTGVKSEIVALSDLELNFGIAETCIEQDAGAIITTVTNGIANYDLEWQGNGNSGNEMNNSSSAITVADLGLGDYTITVTDSRGCSAIGETTVTEYDIVADMVSDDPCSGLSNGFVGATPIDAIPDFTFLWSDNSIGGVITDLGPGTYTVTITDINGCTATGEQTLENYELVATLDPMDVCSGNNTGSITTTVENATDNVDYEWSDGSTGSSLLNVGAGDYAVTITDDKGCFITSSATISEFDSPTATAGGDTTIEQGESTEVTVVGSGGTTPYTYQWVNGPVSDPNAATTQAAPNETTTYTVIVTDENGCFDLDTVLIIVVPEVIVSMPTAFSPNSDDKNDVYEPIIPNMDADIQTFQVFDRWGKLIHNDPTIPWDGKYKGKDQPVGTYVYLVEYFDLLNRKASINGHFNLIR